MAGTPTPRARPRVPRPQVARIRGHDLARVVGVASASVQRPVASPPDISMDSSRLEAGLPGFKLTPFAAALRRLFDQPA